MENTECLIVKARASFFDLKVGVSLNHSVSLRFVSPLACWTCWATFKVNNKVRSAPASCALTLASHQSHNVRTTLVTYMAVDKGMELKGKQR